MMMMSGADPLTLLPSSPFYFYQAKEMQVVATQNVLFRRTH